MLTSAQQNNFAQKGLKAIFIQIHQAQTYVYIRSFDQFVEQGYKIGLESLQIEQIKINNVDVKLNNLHSQTARVFIETLLISYYLQNGLTLLNQ